jgi:hypothetical protein
MAFVDVNLRIQASDSTGPTDHYEPGPIRFPRGAIGREVVTLPEATFTALDPPDGAKAVLIEVGDALSLSLKSVTGDAATNTIAPAANPTGVPYLSPLGATPTLGILNSYTEDQEVVVWWW